MRFFLIAVLALSSLPTYAGPRCETQVNVTQNLCAESFKVAFGRDFQNNGTPLKKAENSYGYGVCLAAGKGAQEDCNNGKYITSANFSCDEASDALQENIDFGCREMDHLLTLDNPTSKSVAASLSALSMERRKELCRKAYHAAINVTAKACAGKL